MFYRDTSETDDNLSSPSDLPGLQSGAFDLSALLRFLLEDGPSELLFLFSPDLTSLALEVLAALPALTTDLDVFGRALKK